MIPEGGALLERALSWTEYPSKTYAMDVESGRIAGYADGLDAVRQAVYKILNTERFEYDAYSGNYGVELVELIGMPVTYVIPELKRLIPEALTWDRRIESVDGFRFEVSGGKVHATFTVHSVYGEFDGRTEVAI